MNYYFNPTGRHWNVTTKEVYEVLLRAGYDVDQLVKTEYTYGRYVNAGNS